MLRRASSEVPIRWHLVMVHVNLLFLIILCFSNVLLISCLDLPTRMYELGFKSL